MNLATTCDIIITDYVFTNSKVFLPDTNTQFIFHENGVVFMFQKDSIFSQIWQMEKRDSHKEKTAFYIDKIMKYYIAVDKNDLKTVYSLFHDRAVHSKLKVV